MAGSADITGKQNYVMGIGHPKSTPTTESPPVTVQTNLVTGGRVTHGSAGALMVQLANKLAQVPVRTFVLGDSMVDFGVLPSDTSSPKAFTTRSWVERANQRLGQRLNLIGVRGHGGWRLDQIAAAFKADLAEQSASPTLVIVEGGSNDIDQGGVYSDLTAFAALMSIYKQCQSIGAAMLYVGTFAGNRSGAASQQFARLRTLAQGASLNLQGFLWCDLNAALLDYTASATNMTLQTQLAAYSVDGTHPSGLAAVVLGDALFGFLDPILPKQIDRVSSNAGGSSGNPCQLISNNLLASGGSPAGTVGTGGTLGATFPDRFDLRRTAGTGIVGTINSVARSDGGPGRFAQIAVSGAASEADVLNFSFNAQNNFSTLNVAAAIGTVCYGQAEVLCAVTSGTIATINLVVTAYSSVGNNSTPIAGAVWEAGKYVTTPASAEYQKDGASVPLTIRTPKFTLPAGTDHISLEVRISTSAGAVITVNVGNPCVVSDQWTALLPAGYF